MQSPGDQTVAILLASGLSRRFKRRDKLLEDLGGKPLVEHMAGRLADIDFRARVAVCPSRNSVLRSRLEGRFIIAPNASPEAGLGVSVSVGVRVAMQFRPRSVLLCLADMAFIEPATIINMLAHADANDELDVVHSGKQGEGRPPAVFGRACFEALQVLTGDQGAGKIVRRPDIRSVGLGLSETELFDVDTQFDLETAREQWRVRERCLAGAGGSTRMG